MFNNIPRLPATKYSELDMLKLLLWSFFKFCDELDGVPVRDGFTKFKVEALTRVICDWKSQIERLERLEKLFTEVQILPLH